MTKHGVVREKYELALAKLRQINDIPLNAGVHHGLREPVGAGLGTKCTRGSVL